MSKLFINDAHKSPRKAGKAGGQIQAGNGSFPFRPTPFVAPSFESTAFAPPCVHLFFFTQGRLAGWQFLVIYVKDTELASRLLSPPLPLVSFACITSLQ
ncbi:hypothetical protein B566_EDAN003855 [Ephemera danica]|nr:hypothetical protein B566_EDAN003855 [Ephemera danica]